MAQCVNRVSCIKQQRFSYSKALSLEVVAGQVIAAMDGLGLCATLNVTDWPADRQRDALTQLLTVLLPDVERIKKFC